MTDDKIDLRELLVKGSDATVLRETIGFAAERLMALETDGLCGAGHGGRRHDGRGDLAGSLEPEGSNVQQGHGIDWDESPS